MPELPEVETVRRGLEIVAQGHEITAVVVTGRRSVRRQSREEFVAALMGRTIDAISRHGKYLYLGLDDGAMLVIHLRMSGKLVATTASSPLEAHSHIVLTLDSGDELRFIDPRTFGEMFVSMSRSARGLPVEITHLGLDPVTETLETAELYAATSRRHVALKALLLDQQVICGIGSIYADEIRFRAGLRPDRRTDTLEANDVAGLMAAIDEVLGEAIDKKGSSLRDASYRDLFGELGSYQHAHQVYARSGEPCCVCGATIQRLRVAGRSAHLCPHCQT